MAESNNSLRPNDGFKVLKGKLHKKMGKKLTQIILIALVLFFIFPFFYLLSASFKTTAGYLESPILPSLPFTLENFQWAFIKQNMLSTYMVNTIVLITTAFPMLIMVLMAGFAIGKITFRGRRACLYALSAVMVIPQMVLTVPLYRLLATMGLIDTIPGLVMVYIAYFGPYSAYLMTTYFADVPDTFIEAALMDGASPFKIFGWIMIPMAAPMIMTVSIIAAQQVWNELTFALVLVRSSGNRTIMAAMALISGQYGIDEVRTAAMLLLASLPMLILYMLFQKRIQLGILAGGVKE